MRWRINRLRAGGLLVLLGANAALLAWIWILVGSNSAADAESVRWNVNWPDIGAKASNPKPLDSYRQILAHPVFFKSREPFVPAPPPPPPPAPAAPPPVILADPGLVVGGVMIKNGAGKAYFYSKAGTSAAGWSVSGS